jgi:hypothetical protein
VEVHAATVAGRETRFIEAKGRFLDALSAAEQHIDAPEGSYRPNTLEDDGNENREAFAQM